MRIKVYLFSKYAKARAQSFSVFFYVNIYKRTQRKSLMRIHANIWHLIGRLNQTAADRFLPLRAFKPSYSDSADRGRSIIRVTFTTLLLKSFSYRLIIEKLPLHLLLENLFVPPCYWRTSFTALLLKSFFYRLIIGELFIPHLWTCNPCLKVTTL
jgi:hypothetical protein